MVSPPDNSILNRRKVITPMRERPSKENDVPGVDSSASLKSILAFDAINHKQQPEVSSDDNRKGRRASPMALRTSFEGGSFANVKVCIGE